MKNILKDIYVASLKFMVPLTTRETYKIIVKEAAKLVGAEYGSIYLAQDGLLYRAYSSVPHRNQLEPRLNGYTYKAFQKRKLFIHNTQTLHEYHPELENAAVKSLIVIPLSYRKESLGVLSLRSKNKAFFDEKRIRILKLFGSMASLAIRNNKLQSDLQQTLETRDLFISLAAHEFRTPMTTIYLYGQLLQRQLIKKELPKLSSVNTLVDETQRLIKLINEFLQLDQIKKGKFIYKMKSCSLRKIIDSLKVNFKALHPKYKLVTEGNLERGKDLIYADFDKILQVLNNILNNATKFSSPKSEIKLLLQPHASFFVITVQDKGIGVDPKDLPHLFKSFYKGQNNKKSGMGLGLFLSKNIIKDHKGKISITSKLKKGTNVEIQLPRLKQ